MDDLVVSAEKIASFMRLLTSPGRFRLKFRITAGAGAEDPDGFERRDDAIDDVKETGQPFHFPALNSRERRMLHMFLVDSGLQTASSGEGPRRHVVLYPAGHDIPVERPSYTRGRGTRGPRGNSGGRGRY